AFSLRACDPAVEGWGEKRVRGSVVGDGHLCLWSRGENHAPTTMSEGHSRVPPSGSPCSAQQSPGVSHQPWRAVNAMGYLLPQLEVACGEAPRSAWKSFARAVSKSLHLRGRTPV